MIFPCTGCGLCCMSVGRWVSKAQELVRNGSNSPEIKEVATFPYPIKENGSCGQLNEKNECSIYDHRPLVCSIEGMWHKYHQEVSKEEYFRSAANECNKMINEAGLDKKYLVEIPEQKS